MDVCATAAPIAGRWSLASWIRPCRQQSVLPTVRSEWLVPSRLRRKPRGRGSLASSRNTRTAICGCSLASASFSSCLSSLACSSSQPWLNSSRVASLGYSRLGWKSAIPFSCEWAFCCFYHPILFRRSCNIGCFTWQYSLYYLLI